MLEEVSDPLERDTGNLVQALEKLFTEFSLWSPDLISLQLRGFRQVILPNGGSIFPSAE